MQSYQLYTSHKLLVTKRKVLLILFTAVDSGRRIFAYALPQEYEINIPLAGRTNTRPQKQGRVSLLWCLAFIPLWSSVKGLCLFRDD